MKRYQFRLGAVLRLRRAEQEQARTALASANTELRALILHRDELAGRYAAVAGRAEAVSPEALAAERHDAEIAFAALARAERLTAEAATRAAMAQVAWLAAHRRVLALERLEERRRAEHEAEMRREEAALIDEIANARYLAAAAAAPGDHR